jgi:hypothetical protein
MSEFIGMSGEIISTLKQSMAHADSESEPKQGSADGKSELVKGREQNEELGTLGRTALQQKLKRFEYAEGAD